jgi:hypothetical protein
VVTTPRQRDARERALGSRAPFRFGQCLFDHPKLQKFELNFKIFKHKSGRGIEGYNFYKGRQMF